jgi:uncharacterized protein involved in response to NO
MVMMVTMMMMMMMMMMIAGRINHRYTITPSNNDPTTPRHEQRSCTNNRQHTFPLTASAVEMVLPSWYDM